ncbi:MAG: DUF72 domain-containing protein [Marmoricola sp.]
MGGRVRVGISGWRYASWRGDFYPAGLPQRSELAYAAGLMTTIELNGPFYSLQRPSSYQRWYDETPEDFVFAVKGGRYITHLKRLQNAETALANFFASGPALLREKLGPFLWQLPERLDFDLPVLDAFLAGLPRSTTALVELAARHDDKVKAVAEEAPQIDYPLRHALEVRSTTFQVPAFADLLRDHGVACVLADTAGRWPQLDIVTAPFDYIRLHGDQELYASRYSDAALRRWSKRCRDAAEQGRDVYVYFDNDARGHAPHDALRLAQLVGASTGVAAAAVRSKAF